ncbi:hypothetical protein AO377_0116 [Moraxella catarrhalis]|nr:hypothetical protein AO377_0116 [Moraxella catarrhalis]OAV36083.1 hypothetical protein AO365_0969 [Moraxella catarrhalis]
MIGRTNHHLVTPSCLNFGQEASGFLGLISQQTQRVINAVILTVVITKKAQRIELFWLK